MYRVTRRAGPNRDLLVQFDEGELRRPIDGDDEIELPLSGPNFGDVDNLVQDSFAIGPFGNLTLGCLPSVNSMPADSSAARISAAFSIRSTFSHR